MTAGVTIGITIYAFTTKTDFTYGGALLFVVVIAFLISGLFLWFVNIPWMYTVYSFFGVIIYSIYLIYDT